MNDTSQPGSSTGKKRRSWFEHGQSVRFDIAVEHALKIDVPSEETEILVLTPFMKPPIVDFGKVTIGQTKSCQLCVRNPHNYVQQVILIFCIVLSTSIELADIDFCCKDKFLSLHT
jgi:Abnormal spindle-like microcephaly-assoc'd, ASPM-SPD-2-Hydin